MPLKAGFLLHGQCEILGQGGFGFVYLARDDVIRRDVAIRQLILSCSVQGGSDDSR